MRTDEARKNMSLSHLGKKRPPHSKEWNNRISIANKGKIYSDENRQKMSFIRTGVKRPDVAIWMKKYRTGTHHTDETKRKMSLAHKALKGKHNARGENHYAWKGGRSSQYRTKHAPRPKPERCEVCGALDKEFRKGLFYDHDHTTGKFRGWICMRCNSALGMVKDNIEILLALAEYIKKSKCL